MEFFGTGLALKAIGFPFKLLLRKRFNNS